MLREQLKASRADVEALRQRVREGYQAEAKRYIPAPPVRKVKAAKHITRVIVPDSHGNHIDPIAARVFLRDLAELQPDHIVMLGDHLDCGGTFNAHQKTYTNELVESYHDDVKAANGLLDAMQEAAPNVGLWDYIEGNHEQHVERWTARNMHSKQDADDLIDVYGPAARLFLKRRGISYYQTKEFYDGLTVPGTIKRGKVYFTHGVSHSKHADAAHLERFNANVVFGHVHRSMSVVSRTVSSQGHGAWCPGTLAKLQPLYRHTQPTTWTHGYAVQFANASSGRFVHYNIPIYADGTSGLTDMLGALKRA